MTVETELLAKTLVDEHYAAGPEQMAAVIAKALAEQNQKARPVEVSREQLLNEVAEQVQASARGSE